MGNEAKCYHREVAGGADKLLPLATLLNADTYLGVLAQFRAYCEELLCDLDFANLYKDDELADIWKGTRA